ncbi:hypothetical protein O6H91_11G040100 [Diphasiastrum complanatum]|uniref:Uncharacterized protein n=2 Tax=Diphasiastrum complanatum TaxID=34168 RepID=A0ACC2C8D5_DIPCM|nr:hypothetical protein O6H91_11G039800 [Diphasiastrum complanatum]KAJ7538261.1 hypothetical protein O6H91_11G040100 [Diphasiastrum complanatum]
MGNCVGGFAKPPPTASIDKSRKQNILKRGAHGHAPPQKEWWSSSEMENNLNSRSSQLSAVSVVSQDHQSNNQDVDLNSHLFVNHALNLWNEQRRAWVGNRSHNQPQQREPVISWTATYDELLATSRPFSEPIPLAEMVDFLVDIWEQEGLYD